MASPPTSILDQVLQVIFDKVDAPGQYPTGYEYLPEIQGSSARIESFLGKLLNLHKSNPDFTRFVVREGKSIGVHEVSRNKEGFMTITGKTVGIVKFHLLHEHVPSDLQKQIVSAKAAYN